MKPRQPFDASQNGANSCGLSARWECEVSPPFVGVFFILQVNGGN